MGLIDDETLREVGRFTIEFNLLDEAITAVAAAILQCSEWDVAEHLTNSLTLGRKLERSQEIGKTLATKYGLLGATVYKKLLEQIRLAKQVVDDRNTVIHGEVKVIRGQQPIVQLKKQKVELSPTALSRLSKTIDSVTNNLLSAYTDFMHEIYLATEKAAAPTKKPHGP